MTETFGQVLRQHRLRCGVSQNTLARRAGIDPSYVNLIEGPQQKTPSRAVALALASALGASADDRERLLVAAGHCPQVILDAGGWDAYRAQLLDAVGRAIDGLTLPDAAEAHPFVRRSA